jgi:hypothetical protein
MNIRKKKMPSFSIKTNPALRDQFNSRAYSCKAYHVYSEVRYQRQDLVYLVENFFLIKTYIFKNTPLMRNLK